MDDIILDRIPDGIDPRKPIPVGVKLKAVLLQFGLDPADVQYDHRPPLWERKWNVTTGDTVPPANSPEHIQALTRKAHDVVTNGRGGEKRITSAGSDTHTRAHLKRLEDERSAYRSALLRKETGEPKPERRLTKRGHRPLRGGGKLGTRPMRSQGSRP
ncbi:hypothetical protein ACLBYG_21870 [Methylobacterium sp. D53M]